MAVFAPWVATHDPLEVIARMRAPSAEYWFGTDRLGRDIFSRIVYGAQTSLFIGLGAVACAIIFGSVLGATAATSEKWGNEIIMRLMDILMAFPGIALAAVLLATFGNSVPCLLYTSKSNEALTEFAMIEQIPMTQAQRVEKAKKLYEEGYDYFYAITRPVNRAKAVEYFLEAGKLENADALFFLSIHQQNNGNLKEATQAAKRSLELGNEAAKIILGKIQKDEKLRKEGNTLELGNEVTKITVGETQEYETLMKEGFNALKKKVDSGDMHYSDSLGYAYEFGIGTSFSIKEAMKYYEMAAKQNNTMGMTNLANLYLRENKFKTCLLYTSCRFVTLGLEALNNLHTVQRVYVCGN